MPRNVTVTFADGSQHVYQGVPDDATPAAVQARASKEFGKPVKALDGGGKGGAAPAPKAQIQPQTVSIDQMRALAGGKKAEPVGRIFDPVRDFGEATGGAWRKLVADERQSFSKMKARQPTLNPGELAKGFVEGQGENLRRIGDLAGLVFSPLTGATDALVSGPAARVLAKYGPTAYSGGDLQIADGEVGVSPVRPLSKAEAAERWKRAINTALSAVKPAGYAGGGFTVSGGKIGLKPVQDLTAAEVQARTMAPGPAATPRPEPMPKVDRRAAEYVDRLAKQGGVELDALAQAETPFTAGEAIGQKGKTALATLARREGQTGDALEAAVGERVIGRPQRMLDAVAEAAGVHPDAAAGDIKALVERGRAEARPLYDEAYAAGPIETPRLQGLLSRPSVKEAMKRARRLAAEEGESPDALGLVNVEDMDQWASEFPPDAPTLETIKAPRGPAKAPSRGPSLSKFIADNGGIVDVDGELAAMSAGEWHKGKAYQRPIEGSLPADDMALKAWEAGYFPEFQVRPTERQLYDALRDDLRGRGRFAREADQAAGDRFAAREAADEAVYRGHQGEPPPSPEDYVGRPEPVGEPAFAAQPTAKTWDYIKRGLDDVLDEFRDSTTGKLKVTNQSRGVINTLTALRDELKAANPAYGRALERSSDYLEAEGAFNAAGRDLFNANMTEAQFGEKFKGLSEGARQAYRGGMANKFFDLAQTGRLDPKVLKTPRVRAKLEVALGREGAQRLIDVAVREGDLLAFERRYAPGAGSITSEIELAKQEQDAAGPAAQIAQDALGGIVEKGPVRALLGALLKQGQRAVDATVGQTAGMPIPVRDEAGRMLLQPPSELAKALEAFRAWQAQQEAARASEILRLRGASRLAIPATGATGAMTKGSPEATGPRR